MKRLTAVLSALFVLACFLPVLEGSEVFRVMMPSKNKERYYQRLRNMRLNSPENPELSYQLANFFYAEKMYDVAVEEYRRVLKLSPEHAGAKYFLSESLLKMKYYEEAFWLVRDLISNDKENAELYYKAGEILEKMGEHMAAKQYFKKSDELVFGDIPGFRK
ncbi:MAG: hypothetical protein GX221_01090 [Candidatus Riflebacteria bacterium]|nr:hypothetical protein [Candidatus Riflebacteria bacterium]